LPLCFVEREQAVKNQHTSVVFRTHTKRDPF
jgi:hypothetical protein